MHKRNSLSNVDFVYIGKGVNSCSEQLPWKVGWKFEIIAGGDRIFV